MAWKITLAFLLFLALEDIRRKSLSLWLLGGFCGSSLILAWVRIAQMDEEIWPGTGMAIVCSLLSGFMLLLCSRLSEVAIGDGDGLTFLGIGLSLGGMPAVWIGVLSLFLSLLMGIPLWIGKKISAKQAFPFIPFVFFATLLYFWGNG